MLYRVYFLEKEKEKFFHNGDYQTKKEALNFYIKFKKENPVEKIRVVEIDKNDNQKELISYEK
jgi:hypothetical protein